MTVFVDCQESAGEVMLVANKEAVKWPIDFHEPFGGNAGPFLRRMLLAQPADFTRYKNKGGWIRRSRPLRRNVSPMTCEC
jgi:hypothetical protein